jgi:hypothetical protein
MGEENRIQTILARALDGAARVLPGPDRGHDFLLEMSDGSTVAIQTKWAGEGWPQDVRNALPASRATGDANTVIVARHLSPGSIDWLRDHDFNWADESGQARIIGPRGLLVIREPPTLRKRDPSAFAWSPSALTIAETLLASPDRPVLTEELAELSGWSASRTASVLKGFDAQGWTVKRGPARGPRAYRELSDANGMLDAWSRRLIDAPRETRYAHRATRDSMDLLTKALRPALDEHVQWAVSGWAGLELAAPLRNRGSQPPYLRTGRRLRLAALGGNRDGRIAGGQRRRHRYVLGGRTENPACCKYSRRHSRCEPAPSVRRPGWIWCARARRRGSRQA